MTMDERTPGLISAGWVKQAPDEFGYGPGANRRTCRTVEAQQQIADARAEPTDLEREAEIAAANDHRATLTDEHLAAIQRQEMRDQAQRIIYTTPVHNGVADLGPPTVGDLPSITPLSDAVAGIPGMPSIMLVGAVATAYRALAMAVLIAPALHREFIAANKANGEAMEAFNAALGTDGEAAALERWRAAKRVEQEVTPRCTAASLAVRDAFKALCSAIAPAVNP